MRCRNIRTERSFAAHVALCARGGTESETLGYCATVKHNLVELS
jgi:hypothetical protein